MLDYQAIIKFDTATRLLNVFTFEYKYTKNRACHRNAVEPRCANFRA